MFFVNSILKYSDVRNDVIICKSRCKYFLYIYRNKFQFLLFYVVYKYCYSNSYLTKIYVEDSVTDIMKHPVCPFPFHCDVGHICPSAVFNVQWSIICLNLHGLKRNWYRLIQQGLLFMSMYIINFMFSTRLFKPRHCRTATFNPWRKLKCWQRHERMFHSLLNKNTYNENSFYYIVK